MIRGYSDEGRVNVGAFVTPTTKRSLVELAYQRSESVSEVIRQAIAEKIARDLREPRHQKAY
jgi:predicted transcriptional regulator